MLITGCDFLTLCDRRNYIPSIQARGSTESTDHSMQLDRAGDVRDSPELLWRLSGEDLMGMELSKNAMPNARKKIGDEADDSDESEKRSQLPLVMGQEFLQAMWPSLRMPGGHHPSNFSTPWDPHKRWKEK